MLCYTRRRRLRFHRDSPARSFRDGVDWISACHFAIPPYRNSEYYSERRKRRKSRIVTWWTGVRFSFITRPMRRDCRRQTVYASSPQVDSLELYVRNVSYVTPYGTWAAAHDAGAAAWMTPARTLHLLLVVFFLLLLLILVLFFSLRRRKNEWESKCGPIAFFIASRLRDKFLGARSATCPAAS